ncbi:peptide chain release factor N(5)-glutamine methyltransferase [Gryllotalpicola sp.]|uniref:peptide chain release factor N(5)-glutamine methyltransferase n=1 Tax=Gryllotalpicola sp. TaxID=1932787 RepID=UPI002609B2BA|nr:peptide chain release factor N(5)-glutamine methyltransferase [Gryllotalpicola sp.]
MRRHTVTVREALAEVAAQLAAADVSTPEADAELILGHVLDVSRGRVRALAVLDSPLEAAQLDAIRGIADRRAAREPLQHLTGRAAFRSLELAVGPGVFTPRPETELTAQLAIDALRAAPTPQPRAADLGTGSAALALALATEVPTARVWAVEKSPEALRWAVCNVTANRVSNVVVVGGDLTESVTLAELDGTLDVVVSNPPYVPDDAIPRDPEVRLFDPAFALYGGPDGLDVVRGLSLTAWRLLHPGGALVIEHGELQGAEIRGILAADGWRAPSTHRDLTTRDRVTTAIR